MDILQSHICSCANSVKLAQLSFISIYHKRKVRIRFELVYSTFDTIKQPTYIHMLLRVHNYTRNPLYSSIDSFANTRES